MKLFKRNDGSEVKVRDILEKIVFWFRRFEKVGDMVASFDPMHAALPWAGVKFLIEVMFLPWRRAVTGGLLMFVIQIAASDFETYAKMADGLEIVSRVIVQVAEVERDMPRSKLTELNTELSRTIVDTYVQVLKFLAMARRFFDKNAGGKTHHWILHDFGKH